MTGASWFVGDDALYQDLQIDPLDNVFRRNAIRHLRSAQAAHLSISGRGAQLQTWDGVCYCRPRAGL
jgi:hypothetical protein